MCVAAIINEPISLANLRLMEQDNPDGGGVAWLRDGQMYFRRGLTADAIFALQDEGVITMPYMLHFRWATHGDKIPELTHPFPVGRDALSGQLSGFAQKLFIHNGTWGDFRAWVKYVDPTDMRIASVSDTAIAAYFMDEFPELVEHIDWATAIGEVDLNGNIVISRYGMTWQEHEGSWYSNLGWVPRESKSWGDVKSWLADYTSRRLTEKYPAVKSYADLQQQATLDGVDGDSDWLDYVRARYGDEAADAITKPKIAVGGMVVTDEPTQEEFDSAWDAQVDAYMADAVTEDFEVVNDYLAAGKLAA